MRVSPVLLSSIDCKISALQLLLVELNSLTYAFCSTNYAAPPFCKGGGVRSTLLFIWNECCNSLCTFDCQAQRNSKFIPPVTLQIISHCYDLLNCHDTNTWPQNCWKGPIGPLRKICNVLHCLHFPAYEKLAWNGTKWGQEDSALLIQTPPTFWATRILILMIWIVFIFWDPRFPELQLSGFPDSWLWRFPSSWILEPGSWLWLAAARGRNQSAVSGRYYQTSDFRKFREQCKTMRTLSVQALYGEICHVR